MSRNEGGEEGILLIWIILFIEKAYLFSRTTLTREGISVCEV